MHFTVKSAISISLSSQLYEHMNCLPSVAYVYIRKNGVVGTLYGDWDKSFQFGWGLWVDYLNI